jgi:hypothetical protein
VIDPGIEMVILGDLALSDVGSFPAHEIRIIDQFSSKWERELYEAECKNMPVIDWPEGPACDDCTWVSRSREEPYWLTIKTTNRYWHHRLAIHPLADLRYIQTWGNLTEAHYIIPVSVFVRHKRSVWQRLIRRG